jgi:hypothetical protein
MAVIYDALMLEAARISETLVNFYQTTRRYNPEDSHLRAHRPENLKSNLLSICSELLEYLLLLRWGPTMSLWNWVSNGSIVHAPDDT